MQNRHVPSPVMILGCGRSGTSIFGELFDHLTPYTYRSEPPFRDVMMSESTGPQAVKVPRESEGFAPSPGLSFPMNDLRRKWPDVKIFWIVRHPLDAICSLRIGIANNWGHHPKPPDWREWLSRPLIERCAHHWTYLNSVGFRQVATLATTVRFESMIADPRAFSHRICEQIGIMPQAHANDLEQWATRVQDTNNKDFVEAKTSRNYSRPDHSVRVGRWRENLTIADIESVLPIVAQTAERFGYNLTG